MLAWRGSKHVPNSQARTRLRYVCNYNWAQTCLLSAGSQRFYDNPSLEHVDSPEFRRKQHDGREYNKSQPPMQEPKKICPELRLVDVLALPPCHMPF